MMNTFDAWRAWYAAQGLSTSSLCPVSEEDVGHAERRLGIVFPPSYRSYLLSIGHFVLPIHWGEEEMLPIDEVAWFREQNGEWIKQYEDRMQDRNGELPEDSGNEWPISHLRSTLQISSSDKVVFLLDTKSRDHDSGEMKAWLFANYIPGAIVYDSFSDIFVKCQAEVAAQGEIEAAKF